MVPVILLNAYALCLGHLTLVGTLHRDLGASYDVGYEECATIVPYVTEQIRIEERPAVEAARAKDMAALKAAMTAITQAK